MPRRRPQLRRPSASLIISTLALFIALSGGAVAAVAIPSNSVGTAQLRHRAVDHDKLGVGAVGSANVNRHQVQVRIGGACSGWSSIASVGYRGNVSCKRTLPAEVGTPGLTVSVPSGAASVVADESLPGGSAYLVTANPSVTVTGSNTSAQLVAVTCTLQAGSAKATQTATVDLSPTIDAGATALPLTLTVSQSTSPTQVALACTASTDGGSSSPKVTVSSPINAIQTLRNETVTSAGASSAPVTITSGTTTATATTATTTTSTATTTTLTTVTATPGG
jgi:hypothetical protein